MLPVIYIALPSYVIMTTLGAIFSSVFLFFRMERFDFGFKQLLMYLCVGAVCLFIGSRIVFVISMIPEMLKDFSMSSLISYVINGGIVFYGGMLGFLFGIWLCCKKRNDDGRLIFNYFVPAIPLFHAFGRIGCLLGGCCYGIESTFGVSMAADPNVIRFPVQLAESLCNILIFMLLLLAERKKRDLSLLSVYLASYGLCRFALEYLRGDLVRGIWGWFSTSQIISIIIVFSVLGCHIIRYRKRRSLKV